MHSDAMRCNSFFYISNFLKVQLYIGKRGLFVQRRVAKKSDQYFQRAPVWRKYILAIVRKATWKFIDQK